MNQRETFGPGLLLVNSCNVDSSQFYQSERISFIKGWNSRFSLMQNHIILRHMFGSSDWLIYNILDRILLKGPPDSKRRPWNVVKNSVASREPLILTLITVNEFNYQTGKILKITTLRRDLQAVRLMFFFLSLLYKKSVVGEIYRKQLHESLIRMIWPLI